jgi:dihydroorotate dehydrogenase electron transfer subunit
MLNEKCEILVHDELSAGYRLLVVNAPEMAPQLVPGQFVHVKVPALEKSALRRPFSVFNAEDGKVYILYKTVGRGTAALNAANVGETLEIIGPLGHGFPVKCDGAALLVGGGYGVAPLYFLAKRLISSGWKGRLAVFVGGRTKTDLLAVEEFRSLGVELHLATNDGSEGVKGLVTDPLDDEIIKIREAGGKFELFACGPDPMLKAVALRATGTRSKGWISMDRHMICGVGACYACIQKTVRGNSRCCIEGPVFAAEDLVWE